MIYSKRNKVINISTRAKLCLIISLGLVVRASFFIRKRDANDYSQVDPSNLIAVFLIALSILFIANKKGVFVIKKVWNSPFKFFILYCIYCAITAVWANGPVYTIYRSIEIVVVLFLIAYIIFSIIDELTLRAVSTIYLLVTLLGGIGYYIKKGNFNFTAFHTNSYSFIAAFSIIFSYYNLKFFKLYKLKKLVRLSRILFLFAIICLIAGTSSASNVSFLVGVFILVFIINKNNSLKVVLILLSIVLITFWTYFGDSIMEIIFPGKDTNDIVTARGRVGMWQHYIGGFIKNPVFGYGFPSGEKLGSNFGWMTTSSTHNMFLSIAINTGSIGLFLFILFLFNYTFFLIKKMKTYWEAKYLLSIWIIIILNSMSYPALGSHWYYVTSAIFFVMVYSFRILNKTQY